VIETKVYAFVSSLIDFKAISFGFTNQTVKIWNRPSNSVSKNRNSES